MIWLIGYRVQSRLQEIGIRCCAPRTTDTYCACRCPRGTSCRIRSWGCNEVCELRGEDWRPSWDLPHRRDLSRLATLVAGSDCLCLRLNSYPPFCLRPRRAWPSIKGEPNCLAGQPLKIYRCDIGFFLLVLFHSFAYIRVHVCVHADTHDINVL